MMLLLSTEQFSHVPLSLNGNSPSRNCYESRIKGMVCWGIMLRILDCTLHEADIHEKGSLKYDAVRTHGVSLSEEERSMRSHNIM